MLGEGFVKAFEKLTCSFIDFGDLVHVQKEINIHIGYLGGTQAVNKGQIKPNPQDTVRELKNQFLAGVNLVGKKFVNADLERLFKEDNGMMILGANAALGDLSATTHHMSSGETTGAIRQVPAMIVTTGQDTHCSNTLSNPMSVLPIFPDAVLSDTDERNLPLHKAVKFGAKKKFTTCWKT